MSSRRAFNISHNGFEHLRARFSINEHAFGRAECAWVTIAQETTEHLPLIT